MASCCMAATIHAQTFWTEGFGTGCNRGTLASSYTTGPNGAWTILSTGTNDANANQWFVSGTCINTGATNCSGSCLTSASTNATLHVSNSHIQVTTPFPYNLAADTGSSYLTGGLQSAGIYCITNTQAVSPAINCTGKNGITLSFIYFENGQAGVDSCTLMYYNGTTWSTLTPGVTRTPLGSCASPSGKWTAFSVALPISANNNPGVKIGFNWINNDDGVGTDPSFAVDDITLSTTPLGIQNHQAPAIQVYTAGKNVIVQSPEIVKLSGVIDLLGRTIPCELQNNTIALEGQPAGIYFVRLMVNGEPITRKIYLQ